MQQQQSVLVKAADATIHATAAQKQTQGYSRAQIENSHQLNSDH